jgi:hypothetical protein
LNPGNFWSDGYEFQMMFSGPHAEHQYEVIVRISTAMGLRTLFVMEVVPEGSGSRMTM